MIRPYNVRFVVSFLILIAVSSAATALQSVYVADSLPSASGWQVYGGSVENGNGITSSIVQDSGSGVWKLIDGSASLPCIEKYTALGSISFDLGVTVAARIKCENSTGTSYNLGISKNGVGGMFLCVKTDRIELVSNTGGLAASYMADGTGYHTYYLTVKNAILARPTTATWTLYRDDVAVISYKSSGTPGTFDGFVAGHVGSTGVGTWYFDWIALRNDGAYGPSAWNPVPGPPPAAPIVTFPSAGAILNTRTPRISWQGDAHDAYEVHINTTNVATDAGVWDSGQVTSTADSCLTPALPTNTTCYLFVRLHALAGWGQWSTGIPFTCNPVARIIPEPQQLTLKTGGFLVNANTRIVMNTGSDSKDLFAAKLLRRKVWDMTGQLLSIVQGGTGAPTTNIIAIGDQAKNTAVESIISSWSDAAGKVSRPEGYMLGIRADSIVITGFDQRGTFWGLQTFIQLLEQFRTNQIAGLFCYDYPDSPWRGTYFRVRQKFDVPFIKQVFSEVAARYKMNELVFDISYGTIWNSHPELYVGDPAAASRMSDMVSLPDYCRDYCIEPIPYCSSWVHAWEWITSGPLNNSLRERPTAPDDDPQPETLCPRNPAAQALVHDLWEELIGIFHPTYMHIGWDEIGALSDASCPYCAGQDPVASFNTFLWNDFNYLNARGIRPIMWGDMLDAGTNGSQWNTYQVLPTMPKAMIINDWDYGTTTDHTTLATWNAHGLSSLGAGYGIYAPGISNIYYWGTSARKYGAYGLSSFNKWRPGYRATADWGELSMWVHTAAWGWNSGNPNYTPAPFNAQTELLAQLAPDVPTSLTASVVSGGVRLAWTNPSVTPLQGTWIVYRTDRFPTDPIDGILVGDVNGSPNAAMTFTHSAAPLGATIYYAAFSHDSVRHFSPVVTATVNNGAPLALGSLGTYPDSKALNVGQCIVTAVYQHCFYVEDANGLNGIRVESTETVSEGNILTINGLIGKTGVERSLTALSVLVTGQKTPPLAPPTLNNSAVGGADRGYVPGATGGVGTNNVGLLVRSFGQIQNIDPNGEFFYINDGCSANGVKVKLIGGTTSMSAPAGQYAVVTGISCLDTDGSPMVWPRSQIDIQGLE